MTLTSAQPSTSAPETEDRARAWEELLQAERDLTGLRTAVRRAAGELDDLDERLTGAEAAFDEVRAELEDAEARLAAAEQTQRATSAQLETLNLRLADNVEAFRGHRSRQQERAISAFKYGRGPTGDVLIRGVSAASDWHEVAITIETVSRMVEEDRALADDAAVVTRDTAALEAEMAALRQQAVDAAKQAADEQQVIEALVARQATLVAEVATERADRAGLLLALEADVEVREALVTELEGTVAELDKAIAEANQAAPEVDHAAQPWVTPVRPGQQASGSVPTWAGQLPPAGRTWAASIDAIAARHGLDGRLMAALVWTESAFNPQAVSHAGAIGLAQLMPGTARGLGVDPYDPIANLEGGTRYLRDQIQRFGRVDLGLAAYNAGPTRVARLGRIPNIVETQLYVVRVLERYQLLLDA